MLSIKEFFKKYGKDKNENALMSAICPNDMKINTLYNIIKGHAFAGIPKAFDIKFNSEKYLTENNLDLSDTIDPGSVVSEENKQAIAKILISK